MEYVKRTKVIERIFGKYKNCPQKKIEPLMDELNEVVEQKLIEKNLDEFRKDNRFKDKEQEECDCSNTQACEVCAESKGIDWDIIK